MITIIIRTFVTVDRNIKSVLKNKIEKRMDFQLFYDLLRVALGNQKCLSRIPSDEEWTLLFEMAEKQAVDGIAYEALEVLARNGQKPPEDVMLDWFSYSKQIIEQNSIINQRCKEVTALFTKAGYKTCILKGQGNAMMYPNPMLRVPGDIDIWVDAPKDELISFLEKNYTVRSVCYHHIDAEIFDDVETEVHCVPSFTYSYGRHRKYQKFFKEERQAQFANYHQQWGFTSPTDRFNVVYQLLHIFRHVFHEGIGLRQLVDYFYLLTRATQEDRQWAYGKLKWLGLERFAGAVMYVEKEVFHISDSVLLCEPEEEAGKFMLEEILRGGNFGQFDQEYEKRHSKTRFYFYIMIVKRLFKMIRFYPSEVLWAPIWKPMHYLWRIAKGYKIE